MPKNRLLLLGTLLIIGIILFTTAFFAKIGNKFTYRTPHDFSSGYVLVINIQNLRYINQAQLLAGNDGILVINPHYRPVPEDNPWFTSMDALMRLDLNHDGQLDARDPAFNGLEFVAFDDNGKQQKHWPLADIGVKAIKLYNNRIHTSTRTGTQSLSPVGQALMLDNTVRTIWLLPINSMPDISHDHS